MAASVQETTLPISKHEAKPIVRRAQLIGSPEPIAALNRVRILEYALPFADREPLVDVRTHCPNVKLSEHLCPYLRLTTADMLNTAQVALPVDHKLQIGTCLRTLSMQQHGWDNYNRKMLEQHPEWPLSTLRRSVNKYFAPYDQPAPPGHCTGGAVDVALLGPDGDPLDVLGPTKGWEAAYTWSDKIGDTAKANRMIMVEAMLNAGFSNCRDEYWHYSWGDSAWAVRTGASECPYGWTYPAVELDIQTPEGTAEISGVSTVRDQEGRPVKAEANVRMAKGEDSIRLRFRINWAKGLPITIHIHTGGDLGTVDPHSLLCSSGEDDWVGVPYVYSETEAVVLSITPESDRMIVTNFASAPKLAEEDKAK